MKSIIKFFLNSSEDPNQLSMTLKGIMGAVASFVTLLASFHGGQTISTDMQAIIVQNATVTISSMGLAIGALATLWGLGRKFVNQFKPWESPKE